jgi:hypothetical protein
MLDWHPRSTSTSARSIARDDSQGFQRPGDEPYGCRRNLAERGIDSCDEANPATRIELLVAAKVRGELARCCWSETDHFNRSRSNLVPCDSWSTAARLGGTLLYLHSVIDRDPRRRLETVEKHRCQILALAILYEPDIRSAKVKRFPYRVVHLLNKAMKRRVCQI